MHISTTLLSAAAFAHLSIAGYVLEDDYMTDFYGAFDFWNAPDPTNGFVKYVDMTTAQGMGLMNSTPGVVSWGVDTTNPAPEGRPSIRLTSKKSYEAGLVVLDVAHMPTGCGTWPAFWMVGPDWPNSGEIDILEGVNEQENNAMTLHTGPGCSITDGGFSGSVETQNCDVKADGQAANAGCSIKHPSSDSYGAGLNAIGGGVYATQWTDDAINVWYFKRGSVPADALGASPDPASWGTPDAHFANTGCDIAKIFKGQQIVFDTTFCGDWAGNVWSSGSCASKAPTCNEYVANNPSAFMDAGWTINALKVYQDDPNAAPPAPPGPTDAPPAPITTEAPPAPGTTDIPAPAPGTTDIPAPAPGTTDIPAPAPGTTDIPAPVPGTTDIPAPVPGTEAPPAPMPTGTGFDFTVAPIPTGAPAPSGPQPPMSAPLESGGPVPSMTAPVAPQPSGGDDGVLPGFNFPGGPGGSKVPVGTGAPAPPVGTAAPVVPIPSSILEPVVPVVSSDAPPYPIPTGAAPPMSGTGVPVEAPMPTGTGGASHEFVSGMPTDMPGMYPCTTGVGAPPPAVTRVSTVYNTVYVTVPYSGETPVMAPPAGNTPIASAPPAGPPSGKNPVEPPVALAPQAPAETPEAYPPHAPGAYRVRHARQIRRRQTQHNKVVRR